jgi:hypothetical protein
MDAPDAQALPSEALPAYTTTPSTPRRERVQHVYTLTKEGGTPWLTLTIGSRASSAKSLPYIPGGEPLQGIVELNLAKPEWICGVDVQARMS